MICINQTINVCKGRRCQLGQCLRVNMLLFSTSFEFLLKGYQFFNVICVVECMSFREVTLNCLYKLIINLIPTLCIDAITIINLFLRQVNYTVSGMIYIHVYFHSVRIQAKVWLLTFRTAYLRRTNQSSICMNLGRLVKLTY